MIKLAFYGKGGIGKSTAASNVSIALAQKGLKVMQIGCDPKADSTIFLHGGERIPTVLDLVRKGESFDLEDMVRVLCALKQAVRSRGLAVQAEV